MPKPGRPSDYTTEIGDLICERIADGKSLRSICLADDMPNKSTVFRWLGVNPSFRDQYARAREEQAEALADEIIDIADSSEGAETNTAVQSARLRVEARKWTASKLKPKKYGDKALIGSDPENPLPSPAGVDPSALSTAALKEIAAAKGKG